MRTRDRERLTELSGSRTERAHGVEPAAYALGVNPVRRLERAHENRFRNSLHTADEIQAPVDAVRAVDVRVARRSEHRLVAFAAATEAVAGRIFLIVRLDL